MPTRAPDPRLDRLVGDTSLRQQERGGGFPVPSILQAILNHLQDHQAATTGSLVPVVQNALINKDRRVAAVYGNAGYAGLVQDALAVLHEQDIVSEDDSEENRWALGPAFQTGVPLSVVRARKGKNEAIGIMVWNSHDREVLSRLERQTSGIHGVVHDLRPDGPGLRPLDEHRVDYLARRIAADGYDPHYPILVDQHEAAYILSGRHRRAACERLGLELIEPRVKYVHPVDDAERFLIATRENDVLSWSPRDLERLAHRVGMSVDDMLGFGSNEQKHQRIDEMLIASPHEGNREIARRLQVGHALVGNRRRLLEETGRIDQFPATRGGRGRITREPASPEQPAPSSSEPPRSTLIDFDGKVELARLYYSGVESQDCLIAVGLPPNISHRTRDFVNQVDKQFQKHPEQAPEWWRARIRALLDEADDHITSEVAETDQAESSGGMFTVESNVTEPVTVSLDHEKIDQAQTEPVEAETVEAESTREPSDTPHQHHWICRECGAEWS